MTPGCYGICPTCTHYDEVMAGQGHPSPCAMVRWQGHQHTGPDLLVDGENITCRSRVESVEASA